MEEYAKIDNRVIPLYKKNGGLSDARNAGIEYSFKNSDSLWITFIDSDDCIHPQYLELLYDAVIKQNTQISVGEILRFKEDFEVDDFISKSKFNLSSPENAYPLEKITSEDLYLRYAEKIVNVSACGKLYRKELFSTTKFPLGKTWEDLATTYKIILSVDYCSCVNFPLYFYYVNPEGIIRSAWTPKRLDEFDAYEQQLAFFKMQEKYKDIYKKLQFTYIKAISYSFNMLINSSQPPKEKKKYKKLLSKKIRKALRQYKEKLPIEKNIGIYETAYPRRMHLYWIFKRITRK
jgi:glycosyltransferase involved in cell wall biosynthesis